MNISNLSNPQHAISEPGLGGQQRLLSEPQQADVELFNAAMGQDTGPMAQPIASLLSERLGDSEKLSQKALRQMKRAAVAEDGSEIVEMSRTLSQCSLQMALTTKIVSKSAQALEKLTNLQ